MTTKDAACLARRASRLAESPTLSLLSRVRALQAQGKRVFEFYIGEPNFTIPPNVAGAIKKALDEGKTDYSHQAGIPELREAISGYFQGTFGLAYDMNNIVVTAGPKDTIFKLLGTIVDPGDKIVVFDPHWEAYGELVELFDGENIFVPRDKDNLSYNLQNIEEAFKRGPKAIFFNDPENPTGYKATDEELRAIAELARKYRVIVLADEIYWLHCYDMPFKSIAHYYPEGTIILSGASKAWAGTGLRIGFGLFPENFADMAQALAKVTGQASSSVNTPTQYGIVEALTNPVTRNWEADMIAEFKRRRDLVCGILDERMGYRPGGAFYVAPKTPLHAEEFSERLLMEEGVAVLPMSLLASGEERLFDRRVRLAYVSDMETLEEGVSRFKEFADRLEA